MINTGKTPSLDRQWRLFFYGENHQLLSNILVAIFNDFLQIGLKYKIILDIPENQQILKRVDKNDISHTAKLADTYFETKFFNRAGNKIKCTLSSGLKKFQKESSLLLNINELDKLKLDIHKCGQFETISKILLQARNINAHWHVPIEDSGNAALVSGSILRLLELFELEHFDSIKLEKLRNLSSRLILSIGMFETNEFQDIETKSEHEESTEKNNENEQNVFPEENDLEETFLEEDDKNETEIDLPDINFNPNNTKEQKRQFLMKLSYELLSDERLLDFNIKRQNCILSRQSIKEFLEFKNFNIDTISNSLTISYLMKSNKKSLEKQIEYYGPQIIKILEERSNATD